MSIKDDVVAHAEACRAARARGEDRPAWTGGLLSNVDLSGADLRGADLRGVDLNRADLRRADLRRADLRGARLCAAVLRDAILREAVLRDAVLCYAVLRDAVLRGAYLRDADLRGADLDGADLTGAGLTGADLSGATLPDGRTLDEWQADPLAGLCDDPESVARALAAWGGRTWEDCPLHAALGANSLDDVPEDRRALAATFVALLDGGHLPRPPDRNL